MSEQNQDAKQPVFAIQKVYVKDVSLESPNSPGAFMEQETPEFSVQFRNQATGFDNGFYEAQLTATIQAKVGERTLFLVEATQAGLFSIENIPAEEMEPLLGIGCPSILFPYLREAVSDLTTRAGFMPFLLQPINFEAIYLQQRAQQAEAANADATTH
ncbi:protein-export chaperone SecB [Silvimonas sp. JCM 19000]